MNNQEKIFKMFCVFYGFDYYDISEKQKIEVKKLFCYKLFELKYCIKEFIDTLINNLFRR